MVIALIGLVLGGFESHVAVILTYYGVLFVLALPFLGLGTRALARLAVGWAIVVPIISHVLRPHLPAPTYEVPSVEQLVNRPLNMLAELTFTGYYPTVPWMAYILAGLAVGRLALNSSRVAGLLTAIGGGLAVTAWALGWGLVHGGAHPTLVQTFPPTAVEARFGGVDLALVHGFYGTTPTTSWWWLTIAAPHSTTPLDLLHTIGTSLLVLGLALLAGRLAPRALGFFFAAGTMTLTLYSLHVLALAGEIGPDRGPQLYAWHVAGALVIGMLWRSFVGQGPLEWFTASFSRLGSQAVLGLPQRRPTSSGSGGG
jgi:hypothetical protein